MKNLVLIKLGGSLITDKRKPYTVHLRIIKRLCWEIHNARIKNKDNFIIGHGGGSFPHVPAKKYKTQEGFINNKSARGISEVQDSAAQLNRIVVREFVKAKENAISFSPSSFLVTKKGEINSAFLQSLFKSLELGMLPVVYGDVTFDETKGCNILSTEKILNFLALKLKNNFRSIKIIYCGITNGVYDEKDFTIKKITRKKFNVIKSMIGASGGTDVTGGMLHKVEEALSISDKGIQTVIINGTRHGDLRKAITGQNVEGTYILK